MSAEADALCGAPYGQRSEEWVNFPQWVPAAGVGHPDWHSGAGGPEAAVRVVLPGLVVAAPPAGRAGPGVGGGHELPAGRVDPEGGDAGRADGRGLVV